MHFPNCQCVSHTRTKMVLQYELTSVKCKQTKQVWWKQINMLNAYHHLEKLLHTSHKLIHKVTEILLFNCGHSW